MSKCIFAVDAKAEQPAACALEDRQDLTSTDIYKDLADFDSIDVLWYWAASVIKRVATSILLACTVNAITHSLPVK